MTLVTSAAEHLGLLSGEVWRVLFYFGLAMILVAGVTWIVDLLRSRALAGKASRGGLEAQLREVDAVRTWLALREDQDARLPLADDRVFQWAKKTYEVIQEAAPAEADAFMGQNHASLGSAYFATAYALRTEQTGRSEYLETRADIVREILRTP